MEFVAIDFETASFFRYSACAVGIVIVRNGVVIDSYSSLIRPPGNYIRPDFTEIHGISPKATKTAPRFREVYPEIRRRLAGRTVVAHNVPFDRSVLLSAMARTGIDAVDLSIERFDCTVRIYRKLGYRPANLARLTAFFGIPLMHHDALSDAMACAALYVRAKTVEAR
jgi:DNA polymerase-3 subunit epsilon